LSQIPEVSLGFLSFFLNFFWEVIQTSFYTMKEWAFPAMLYGWIHCTAGDVMISLGSFWIVSLVHRSRHWLLRLNRWNSMAFVIMGVFYTIVSERVNVKVFKSWGYDERMPMVPWIEVGVVPILQWVVVPSVVIMLTRHYLLLQCAK